MKIKVSLWCCIMVSIIHFNFIYIAQKTIKLSQVYYLVLQQLLGFDMK